MAARYGIIPLRARQAMQVLQGNGEIIQALQKIPKLQAFDKKDLRKILSCSQILKYEPGETIATRQAQITLSLPETLRDTTYNTVGGRSAEGSSTDTKIELVLPGKDPAQVPLLNSSAVVATTPGCTGSPASAKSCLP